MRYSQPWNLSHGHDRVRQQADEPSPGALRQRAWRRQRRASRRSLCTCCGRFYVPGRSDQAFCCPACRQLAYRRRRLGGVDASRRPTIGPGLAPASSGPTEHRRHGRGRSWGRPGARQARLRCQGVDRVKVQTIGVFSTGRSGRGRMQKKAPRIWGAARGEVGGPREIATQRCDSATPSFIPPLKGNKSCPSQWGSFWRGASSSGARRFIAHSPACGRRARPIPPR